MSAFDRPGLEHLANIPNLDKYFLQMIPNVKSRSKDKHTQCGCIIVNEFNNIISTGYNSLASGIDDCVPERYERPEKYLWMVHSEENAICAAAKAGIRLAGSKIYISGIPCINCGRMIVQAGIKEIVYDLDEQAKWNSPKYDKEMEKKTKQLLYEAHVTLRGVKIDG